MSSFRYVSTGFGPTSSEVGMFEPVTITSSIVTPGWPVVCGVGDGFCANVARIGQKKAAVIAKHRPVAGGFIAGHSCREPPYAVVANLSIRNKRRFEDSSAKYDNFCHVERSRDISDYF